MLDLSVDEPASRYDRQERITWWDQTRLRNSQVLVVGAGALGNEVLKSLALLGVGKIVVIDCDTIERSNLARCVLFREGDDGLAKAAVVARAAQELNSEITVVPWVANVMELGLGKLQPFDLIICGLDNREARVWINQASRKLGKTWVDGAIEGLRGLARVFPPSGACYECTLGEVDRQILASRKSCALLTPDEMLSGKVPTTATTASIVAAIEVQEAVKILCGRNDLVALNNQALVLAGETLETYIVGYSEVEDCLAHDRYETLHDAEYLDREQLGDVIERLAGARSDPDLVVEFEDDIVVTATCNVCGPTADEPRRVSALRAGDGRCPTCDAELRFDLRRTFAVHDDDIAALELSDLVLPDEDVLTVRSGTERSHFIMRRASAR